MKKIFSVIICLALVLGLAVSSIGAEPDEFVTVTIPEFPVTLNGTAFDSGAEEYPMLLYKDAIYLPLTYSVNSFMGLKTDVRPWVPGPVTAVTNGDKTAAALVPYPAQSGNDGKLTARIQDCTVYLSSNTGVKNFEMEYPLLTFRDVTYLPLTTEVCQTLDWKIGFDAETGLTVDSTGAFRPSWKSPQSRGIIAAWTQVVEYVVCDDLYVGYRPYGGLTDSSDGNESVLTYRFKDGEEKKVNLNMFSKYGEHISFPYIDSLPEDERSYIRTPGENESPKTYTLYLRCIIDEVNYDAQIVFYKDNTPWLVKCEKVPQTPAVTIPNFPVTLNNQTVDPGAGEYPILSYKDVVYLPMTLDYDHFLGLESDCGYYLNNLTAAVTNGEITAQTLEIAPAVSDNAGELTAEVMDYDVYLSSQSSVKNVELEYPLITFRNMTYLPLTWDVCQTLDWDLSYSPETGFVLDTTDAFRPSWSSPQSHGMNNAAQSIETYVLDEDCYAGFYISTINTDGSEKKLIWRRKGQPEKRFGAECLAELGTGVMFSRSGTYGPDQRPLPFMDGNVLTVGCRAYNGTGFDYYILHIDMENEKLLSCEDGYGYGIDGGFMF